MYPAITFKSVGTVAAWCKYKMIVALITDHLCIQYAVIIIQIAIITGRTYKLFIEDGNEIIVDIHILVHSTQELDNAFIFYPIGIGSLDHLAAFERLLLIIIVGNSFCEISRKEFYTGRAVYILID
jgi:hypothetical protein